MTTLYRYHIDCFCQPCHVAQGHVPSLTLTEISPYEGATILACIMNVYGADQEWEWNRFECYCDADTSESS